MAADPEKVQNAIYYERGMEFWFQSRQPAYIKRYTEGWGEWFDDQFIAEELDD